MILGRKRNQEGLLGFGTDSMAQARFHDECNPRHRTKEAAKKDGIERILETDCWTLTSRRSKF